MRQAMATFIGAGLVCFGSLASGGDGCPSGTGKCGTTEAATETVLHTEPAGAKKVMEKLKTLAGRWEGRMEGSTESAFTEFKVTSNGSAVVETMAVGTPHEMVNVYVPDGDRVVVTHYCAMGNAPRMALVPGDGESLKFQYIDGTNIPDENGMYMGQLELIITGPDKLTQKWGNFDKGKIESHMNIEMTRVK